jgi:hypothetical protein
MSGPRHLQDERHSQDARQGGWSLLEVAISISLLVVGVLGTAVGFQRAAELDDLTRGTYVLLLGYRNTVAELSAAEFSTLPESHGPDSGRDLLYLGTDLLDPALDSVGELTYTEPRTLLATAQVTLFDDETSTPCGELDLNADGVIGSSGTGSSGTGENRILPVRVEITVDSKSGPRTLSSDLILVRPSS